MAGLDAAARARAPLRARRVSALFFEALLSAVFVVVALLAATARAQRPNIVLIMADDLGYFDLGTFGSPTIKTPNIDRMAEEGVRFTQWYATSGLCTPSRGAMLTGRYAQRLGLYTRFAHPADLLFRVFYPSSVGGLPANETTIAGALKPYGYQSAIIGKWHLGHNGSLPTNRGFDFFFGTPYSHDEGYPGPFPISLIWPPVPVYRNTEIVEQPIEMETITPRMEAEALQFMDESTERGNPFFIYLAFHEPHIPAFTSEGNAGRSRGGAYGDMVEQLDDSVGRILDKVRSIGNTFVFFTSDNGAWPDAQEPFTPENAEQGDGGSNGAFQEGKASTWEGGVRTPSIAWFPERIPGGRTVREITSHLDLFPTFMEFAEAPLPGDRVYDGKSIVPLLTGQTETGPHEFQFFWRESVLMAVRWGRYKGHFVTRSGFGSEEPVTHVPLLLFDLEKDLGERYPMNITNYPDIVNTILAAAEANRAQMTFGEPQFDVGGFLYGQSWQVIPCCQRQNLQQYMGAPEPPEDWPLILWRNCICLPANSTAETTQLGKLEYVPPFAYAGTQFRSQPLDAFRQFMLSKRSD